MQWNSRDGALYVQITVNYSSMHSPANAVFIYKGGDISCPVLLNWFASALVFAGIRQFCATATHDISSPALAGTYIT